MTENGLPPLRDVIERHGLLAKKSLGQNFLFDLNLTRRISRAAEVDGQTIVEIGPGPGGLTRAMLLEGAQQVIAVERDDRAIAALQEIAAAYPGKLTVINGDAMRQNWQEIAPGNAKIVANLPYNIGTPLLIKWLTEGTWPPWYSSLTLMFQKEVAERIVAKPGTEAFGRLSVLCQWRCRCTKLFDVNRAAFTPPPKITSSIVQLIPKAEAAGNSAALEKVTAAAFGQRRKMLRSSLKSVFHDPASTCQGLGIDPELRAEQLAIEQFLALAAAI